MSLNAKYQKDYKDTDYRNPRLIRQEEKKNKRFRIFIYSLLVIAILGMIYFLFFSSFFYIQSVTVSGTKNINQSDISGIIDSYRSQGFLIIKNNNFWLFSKNRIRQLIGQKYLVEKLEIKKIFPNKITVTITEKEPIANWLTNDLCFQLDATGYAIAYCEPGNKLIIKDKLNQEQKIGQEVINKDDLKYIVDGNNKLMEIFGNHKFAFSIEKAISQVDYIERGGLVIKMNIALNLDEQVARLQVLLNDNAFKTAIDRIQYIDLRFGSKVYYK